MTLKNKFSLKKWQLSRFISTWGISENANELERCFTVLINQYLILLFFIFFFHSISIVIFLGITVNSIFLGGISFSWILVMLLKEYRENKSLIASSFICLSLVVTYYSSFCGQESGVYLFYFSLLSALPFFFELKKDKKIIFFIAGFILALLYITILFDFRLVDKNSLITIKKYEKKLMILNVTFSILVFMVDYYFIERKRSIVSTLNSENEYNINAIKSLQNKNERLLKNQFAANKLTEDNINEIMNLAQKNDPFFLNKFEFFFPEFFSILDDRGAKLILSEQHLCAMMRLNLDTKQIATYTNTTIKSVEGKKYRLRKKLNIPSDTEITQWILSI
ncbi:helix-turn-helix transcriptional regulator [Chryseobacterium sp. MIQD13]|uniref:helix-turn-helix transcriptional regulator n=1 Tax=Chryseobacterium sp. MIQD13 TaxID=3422310 RepID=UPI003D283F91